MWSNSQTTASGECTDDLSNAGTKCETHSGTQNPAPHDGGGSAYEEGSIEGGSNTRAETHDTERKADLYANKEPQ